MASQTKVHWSRYLADRGQSSRRPWSCGLLLRNPARPSNQLRLGGNRTRCRAHESNELASLHVKFRMGRERLALHVERVVRLGLECVYISTSVVSHQTAV